MSRRRTDEAQARRLEDSAGRSSTGVYYDGLSKRAHQPEAIRRDALKRYMGIKKKSGRSARLARQLAGGVLTVLMLFALAVFGMYFSETLWEGSAKPYATPVETGLPSEGVENQAGAPLEGGSQGGPEGESLPGGLAEPTRATLGGIGPMNEADSGQPVIAPQPTPAGPGIQWLGATAAPSSAAETPQAGGWSSIISLQPDMAARSASEPGSVWVTDSGRRYHLDSSCSGMKDPKQVSITFAQEQGYTPCSRCAVE